MTRNSTVIMPMDIHKQAVEKKYWQVEFERQAIRTKAMRSTSRDYVYAPLIEHLFTQTSFNCGFDRYKVIDCFKVQLVN